MHTIREGDLGGVGSEELLEWFEFLLITFVDILGWI